MVTNLLSLSNLYYSILGIYIENWLFTYTIFFIFPGHEGFTS